MNPFHSVGWDELLTRVGSIGAAFAGGGGAAAAGAGSGGGGSVFAWATLLDGGRVGPLTHSAAAGALAASALWVALWVGGAFKLSARAVSFVISGVPP